MTLTRGPLPPGVEVRPPNHLRVHPSSRLQVANGPVGFGLRDLLLLSFYSVRLFALSQHLPPPRE